MKSDFICKRGNLTIRGHVWGDPHSVDSLFILSHPFLGSERLCFSYAKMLSEKGYSAVTYDFCGGGLFGKSDGKSVDMTVMTEKEDLLAVIRMVREAYGVNDISLLGCSQGGLVSGLAAAELGAGKITRLILLFPALCIPDDARRGKMLFYRFDPSNIPEVLGIFPMPLGGDFPRSVIGLEPYRELAAYTGPVLLVHGTKDRIVPVDYARKMRDAYPRCEYVELEGAGHFFLGKARKAACDAIAAFIRSAAVL